MISRHRDITYLSLRELMSPRARGRLRFRNEPTGRWRTRGSVVCYPFGPADMEKATDVQIDKWTDAYLPQIAMALVIVDQWAAHWWSPVWYVLRWMLAPWALDRPRLRRSVLYFHMSIGEAVECCRCRWPYTRERTRLWLEENT